MESRPLRMLSGVEIVERGRNLSDCILPDFGLKEVAPNGSWLEAKQIQTALEARKALVEVDRIDKLGALSHANWNDDIKLAEVTQQVGGHWQYIGHKVDRTLYLLPEEALFLMETNCLLLKHNEVTVSLQKAYSLLLDKHITLTQYKVYASLSRVGYKVFRYKNRLAENKLSDSFDQFINGNKNNTTDRDSTDCENRIQISNGNGNCIITQSEQGDTTNKININTTNDTNKSETNNSSKVVEQIATTTDEHLIESQIPKDVNDNEHTSHSENESMEIGSTKDAAENINPDINKTSKLLNMYQIMKQRIKNRKIPPSDPKTSQDNFENIPDCFEKQVVTVKVPSEEHLPRNIFLNKTSYVLNLQEVKKSYKKQKPTSVENRAMYRTIRNSSESETAAVPTPELPQILPNTPLYQQPFGFFPNWRPRFQNFNQLPRYQFNQHPFFYRMMHFMPQSFTTNRPRVFGFNDQRKRQYDVRNDHLKTIKIFASKLKLFNRPSNNSLRSLQGLVARFNEIYNAKISITRNFDVIDEVVETIDLDDDDVETKRPRLDNANYEKYLASVKALAAKLKNLERKKKAIPKQKKAFRNLLDNFNKTFNTEFELDSKGMLVDKKLVVLDSSSDSDVVASDDVPSNKRTHNDNIASQSKKRKVLNPLNILRKVNEGASTSQSVDSRILEQLETDRTDLTKYFDKKWLPNDNDFGKATPCLKTCHLWRDSQEFYDFISWVDLKTWVDLKLAFCSHMEAVTEFEDDLSSHSRDVSSDESSLKPLLAQDPNTDWASSLEKLRIIKTNTEKHETCLAVDFDVYNRDVQNFRKSDPPKPHFRVVCVDVHSKFPSGAEVRSLHSKYDSSITTVFAVVEAGSITYLQINPKDLPVYVGND